MTIMHVEYQGKLRTRALHVDSGAQLLTDAPKDNNGEGQAFSPTDLLATSLASCMLTIMGIKARGLELDIAGTRCDVEKIMQPSPRKVAEIKVKVTWGGQALSAEQKATLEQAALTCPVFLSLDPALKKTLSWE
jgi:putative redox protein